MDSGLKLAIGWENIFSPDLFKAGFQRVFEPFLRGFQSLSTFLRVSKCFKVQGTASNNFALTDKSALVMGKTAFKLDFDYLKARQML